MQFADMISDRIKYKINRWRNKITHFRFGSCAVLLYHRVTNLETDPQLLAVSPSNFDKHLQLLKSKYWILSVAEFKWHLDKGIKFPPRSVLLTFDDGYADNYLEALPLLEKHNTQALFYIATGTLNTSKEYWWDAIERIVLRAKSSALESSIDLAGETIDIKAKDEVSRLKLYNELLPKLRVFPANSREVFIENLEILFQSRNGRATHRAMTFDELKKMAASNAAVIGAHTHMHPSLGSLNYKEQEQEIIKSKMHLETIIEKKIVHFSYPFGTKKDYNEDTIQILRSAGFELVAANYPKLTNARSDHFQYPRFLVRDWDVDKMETELMQFFNS